MDNAKGSKMNKQCYVRFNEDLHVLYNDRFIRVSLFTFEDGGERCCHLSGPANWEISYTGSKADEKFEELLTLEEVSWDDLKRLGFTQYG
jgi:hypothetical protein